MKIVFEADDGKVLRVETLDAADEAALATRMVDITEWVANFVKEKARRRTDDIVERSGRGSRFTDEAGKKAIITDLIAAKSKLIEPVKEEPILENEPIGSPGGQTGKG